MGSAQTMLPVLKLATKNRITNDNDYNVLLIQMQAAFRRAAIEWAAVTSPPAIAAAAMTASDSASSTGTPGPSTPQQQYPPTTPIDLPMPPEWAPRLLLREQFVPRPLAGTVSFPMSLDSLSLHCSSSRHCIIGLRQTGSFLLHHCWHGPRMGAVVHFVFAVPIQIHGTDCASLHRHQMSTAYHASLTMCSMSLR